jgi:hypothetical protein
MGKVLKQILRAQIFKSFEREIFGIEVKPFFKKPSFVFKKRRIKISHFKIYYFSFLKLIFPKII